MVVRSDLPFGVQCVQLLHAAGESSYLELGGQYRHWPLPVGTRAVALSAPNQAALEALETELRSAGIAHAAIREPDPPYLGQLLALGAAPAPRKQVGRFFKKLSLIGKAKPRLL